ncbi:uncharacterized protein BHQ10_008734 [Talaromyces amestolkiae]|uniref:Uncharacterized protein n=1 Tax=Talaromyces amestolkiae TaxID=1196081 RepID=A0A364LA83_TALAM|nr:uncharacterized protein BHQ10_008734 [Talaromyces amestolkiae]RAO72722.1 hypothetical protein BHQ10_008734 [Talaromyces amestolkiae]
MTQVEDSIPPSAKPLAPYLRSRHDVLRIRQALTLHLQSHIVWDDNDGSDQSHVTNPASHLSLVVPNHANTSVKRIPSEVTGVRKEYLKALQENLAVKSEYNDLFDRITSRKTVSKSPADSNSVPSTTPSQEVFSHYFDLLRERRRYERLQLFDIHLKEWAATSEPPTEDGSRHHLRLDGLMIERNGWTKGSSDNVQALISKLEKTVVRAKAKLAREQHLLKQLHDLQASTRPASDAVGRKFLALQRTRDELVQWVEEKLAITNTEDDTMNQLEYDNGTTSAETVQLAVAGYKTRIQEQYVAYVKARQSLLDALSGLSQPSKSAANIPPAQKASEVAGKNENIEEWGSIDVFRNVSEHILPASKYQKSMALHRSYLIGMLAKEKTNLKHTMDRLSQESHLLPEYPILARQPKFRHITPTASTGISKDHKAGKQDEIVERAQAWAFAAEAARSSDSDYIQQRIEHGAEMADTASEQLQQIYNILHQEQSVRNEDKGDPAQQESDIWTAEVQPRKARVKRNEKIETTKGPWSALDGRVGIE